MAVQALAQLLKLLGIPKSTVYRGRNRRNALEDLSIIPLRQPRMLRDLLTEPLDTSRHGLLLSGD
jgi:hypothetical protein